MYDENKLFAAALGLNLPYQVKKMEFNIEEGELHIHIHFHLGSEFPCPVNNNPCKVRDTKAQPSMKTLANTIKAHVTRILNYFPDHLTSGLMEGINALIHAAKANAGVYRNPRYLETIIYLITGKLDFALHA